MPRILTWSERVERRGTRANRRSRVPSGANRPRRIGCRATTHTLRQLRESPIDEPYASQVVLKESFVLSFRRIRGQIRCPNRRVGPPVQPTYNTVVVAGTLKTTTAVYPRPSASRLRRAWMARIESLTVELVLHVLLHVVGFGHVRRLIVWPLRALRTAEISGFRRLRSRSRRAVSTTP
jgi:hypothetical protein